MTQSLVFATHNQNKLIEVQALMPAHIRLLSLTDIGCEQDIVEDAATIQGNALLKANYVKKQLGYDCFADDTGLEVNALKGAPGVYSARYAGPQKDANDNINKLLTELAIHKDRSAQFKTVIAYVTDSESKVFTGLCKGIITHKKVGSQGFGYDPIFRPQDYDQTFAQMPMALKGKISHRGMAFAQLLAYLKKQ